MRSKALLVLILLGAAFLRLYKLDKFPAGLNADEAALGYNAYSLSQTGRDEHGHIWPVNLESFGDFKPAGYAYLLIPFIKLFGLTEWAVRLPSALFGVAAVWGIYLLCKQIFNIPEIAALLLAINPWHIHFSRGGWEVNVATTLLIFGVWAFLTKRYWFWILSFVLAMYTYQSARLIAPVLGLGLFWLYPSRKMLSSLLLLLLLLPLALSIVTTKASSRLSGVGLLADSGPEQRAIELRSHHRDWQLLPVRLLHNRPVEYLWRLIKNYTDHFNGDFLFISGDVIERSKVPETGLFYLTDILFLVLGIIHLIKHPTLNNKIVWLWLAIAPLASAITFQTPHALRAHNMLIPLTLIISLGVYALVKYRLSLLLLTVTTVWQFARYLHQYYVHYPQTYPAAWEYGFKEAIAYIDPIRKHYQQVLFTDKYDQPYILTLFYSHYSPEEFQKDHELTARDRFNFSTVRNYANYRFQSTSWEKVRDIHSSLIVAAPDDIPEVGVHVVKTVNFPNGQPAFKIISN